ncbi:MAG: hypothetical protein CL624_00610 [Arcobacter sp.]|nr:hypothetical protein [Arcobacter sp.]|tara:strand:+ start:7258 stop:8550 length:1293 start_codon:yes stop_codon:yes gene_type:complete
MKEFEIYKKEINILYVEDDDTTREKLTKFLSRKFNNIESSINGAEGLIKFHEKKSKNEKFDLIISDINMPMMDGITMLEKIREIDSTIPVILITARTETSNLLKAIHLHVEDYITKPLDLEVIDAKLEKITKDLFYRSSYESQKKELENYISIINQEAIVSKINKEGIITFVNEAFCNISLYNEEELIGQPYYITKHPDVSDSIVKNIWKTVLKGETWTGTYKNRAKDNSEYFSKSKIVPLYDSTGKEIEEYLYIQFINTEEEHIKRQNNKNILQQISFYKKSIANMQKELDLSKEENANIIKNMHDYETRYNEINEKRVDLLKQLESYEQNNLENSKLQLMAKKDKNKQFDIIYDSLTKAKSLNSKYEKMILELEKRVQRKDNELEEFKEKDKESLLRIRDLKDLVSNFQKEKENQNQKSSKPILSFGK